MYRSPKSFEMKIKIAAAMGSKTKIILGLHCHPCHLMKAKRKIKCAIKKETNPQIKKVSKSKKLSPSRQKNNPILICKGYFFRVIFLQEREQAIIVEVQAGLSIKKAQELKISATIAVNPIMKISILNRE